MTKKLDVSKKPPLTWTTVKVPAWAHDNAQLLKAKIARDGLRQLSNTLLSPSSCPLCGSTTFVRHPTEIVCAACPYHQIAFTEESLPSACSLGVLYGLGLAALLRDLRFDRPVKKAQRYAPGTRARKTRARPKKEDS